MFCRECGHTLKKGAQFCPECGTPVQAETTPGSNVETEPSPKKDWSEKGAEMLSSTGAALKSAASKMTTAIAESSKEKKESKIETEETTNVVGTVTLPGAVDPRYTPISMWGYFGYEILFSIPVIGLIFLLIYSFGATSNINLRNFARSYFCFLIIVVVIVLIVAGSLGLMFS